MCFSEAWALIPKRSLTVRTASLAANKSFLVLANIAEEALSMASLQARIRSASPRLIPSVGIKVSFEHVQKWLSVSHTESIPQSCGIRVRLLHHIPDREEVQEKFLDSWPPVRPIRQSGRVSCAPRLVLHHPLHHCIGNHNASAIHDECMWRCFGLRMVHVVHISDPLVVELCEVDFALSELEVGLDCVRMLLEVLIYGCVIVH